MADILCVSLGTDFFIAFHKRGKKANLQEPRKNFKEDYSKLIQHWPRMDLGPLFSQLSASLKAEPRNDKGL